MKINAQDLLEKYELHLLRPEKCRCRGEILHTRTHKSEDPLENVTERSVGNFHSQGPGLFAAKSPSDRPSRNPTPPHPLQKMAPAGLVGGWEEQQRILVIDFGSQVTHLICRRVREAGVYSELRSRLVKADEVRAFEPPGIILSGGPYSVYDRDGPHLDEGIWVLIKENTIPVMGTCYGLQEICHSLGGKVEPDIWIYIYIYAFICVCIYIYI